MNINKLVLALSMTFAASLSADWTPGTPNTLSNAVTLTTAQINALQVLIPLRPPVQNCDRTLNSNEFSAHRLPAKSTNPESGKYNSTNTDLRRLKITSTLIPQNWALNFSAMTLQDLGVFPPFPMGAVGPSQFIAVGNGLIRTFDKETGTLDGVLDLSTDVFFSQVSDGLFTSEPRVRYDRASDQWFVIMGAFSINYSSPSRIVIAVSNSGVITSSTNWNFFYFEPQTINPPRFNSLDVADFPTLGIDSNALYIGVNVFSDLGEEFVNSDAFVIRKSSVTGAGPLVVTAFRDLIDSGTGLGIITPQGVDNFDTNPPEGVFIGVDRSYFGLLDLRRIRNAATTPEISDNIPLTVLITAYPLNVPHKGNDNGIHGGIDPIDDRLCNAHIRDGKLYTTHNIGVNYNGISSYSKAPTRTGCRWYEIDLANPDSPTLEQAGTLYAWSPINDPYHRNFFNPSLMTNGLHTIALGCSSAGKNYYLNAAYTAHYSDDEPGVTRPPLFLTDGNTSYNPPGDTGSTFGRTWGYYSHTSLDPNDNLSLWTIQQYCDEKNSYAVQVIKLPTPPPAAIVSVSPSSLSTGVASTILTITGVRNYGSAFYDPGTGFVNRLEVGIEDLVINSIQFVDPTTVQVDVSTVGATTGHKTIVVTNPDGQSSSGKHILNIH